MDDIKRILVLSKSTKHCQKAVHYGVSLARAYQAKLYVMNIIHNPFGLKGWNLPVASLPSLEKEFDKMLYDAKADLDRIITHEKINGLAIEELVIEGDPSKELFGFIEKQKIDLLIMLAYEQWRLEHFFFGREIHEIVRPANQGWKVMGE